MCTYQRALTILCLLSFIPAVAMQQPPIPNKDTIDALQREGNNPLAFNQQIAQQAASERIGENEDTTHQEQTSQEQTDQTSAPELSPQESSLADETPVPDHEQEAHGAPVMASASWSRYLVWGAGALGVTAVIAGIWYICSGNAASAQSE